MSDVYSRMEELATRGRDVKPLRQRLVEAALLVLGVFLLGYLLYAAQFSGTVRWFLGFALIAAVAAYAWHLVARGTAEPAPLVRPAALARGRAGELETFTLVVRRANQGLPYSQVAVSSRAREAFEERTRLARGLSLDGVRRLEREPAGLRAVFHDPVLEEFLYLPSLELDARYRWVEAVRERGRFDDEFMRILDRMEGWR